MSTFWLKVAGIVVVVVIVIILISTFTSSNRQPAMQQKPQKQEVAKNIYEQWDKDDQRLRAEPEPLVIPQPNQPQQQTQTQQQSETQQTKIINPVFRELSIEEKVAAEKLYEMAITERKMGRLPGVRLGYKKMVDHCREIIQRWPDSEYAFKAKKMLADIPPRYHEMYNITKDELDLSSFYPTSD